MSTQADKPKSIADVIAEMSKGAREKFPQVTEPGAAATASVDRKIEVKAVRFEDYGSAGLIVGIGGSISKDKEGDEVERASLRKLAHEFCTSKSQLLCANHDEGIPIDGGTVGYWVGAPVTKSGRLIKPGEDLPKDDPVVAINFEKGNDTHWFFELRPSDPEILEAARKGEIVGFSWAGMAQKEAE